jgi:LacI family transcriptional regulator
MKGFTKDSFMATIKDVAQKAGVSIGTVSNVLNHLPTVNETIRKRVLKAVKDLHFKPNRAAKSLVSGRSQTLAFIIPDICNPFFPEMVRGATGRADALGYSLFLGNVDNDPVKETEYIRGFVSQGVDGLIIATSDLSPKESPELDQISDLDLPVVMVDRELEGLERDLVIVDNVRCAYLAMRHLAETSRERIGMIHGPLQTMTARQRLEGGRKALEEKRAFREELVRSGPFTFESGWRIMHAFLREEPKLDAVFCGNDMIALGVMRAIEEDGLRVAEDIAVTGFDDLYISSLVKPALTTIHQPTYELGATAVSMVVERIQGKAAGLSRKVILPGELVIRESTRKHEKK